MKIGFDAKRIMRNKTGLGNYSRLIVNLLTRYAPAVSSYLFTPQKGRPELLSQLIPSDRIHVIEPRGLGAIRPFNSLWRVFALAFAARKERLDLFHGLSGELPLFVSQAARRSVVTIHDLIFLRYPEYYKPVDRLIYRLKFASACRRADRIVAISECTKRDILSYFGIPAAKVAVCYQGCDELFKHPVGSESLSRVKAKYALPDRFVLSVGSIERRKNLRIILEALALLKDQNIPLVVVGKPTPYLDELKEYLRHYPLPVTFLHQVSFDELPALYQAATLFAYPSRFEGFGIPIIEAIHSGLPVLAATGSCLEEAGGEGAVYADPDDAAMFARLIRSYWDSPALCEELNAKGRLYVRRFEPEALAGEMIAVYDELLQSR